MTPRSGGIRGLPVRTSAIASAVFILVILGAGLLKSRHLRQVADRVAWSGPEFELTRPGYDRIGFESGIDGPRNPRARELYSEGMVDFLHADDRHAQARFLRAVALEPDWPRLRFYLGVSRLFLGFPVGAAEDLQAAADAGFHPPGAESLWWLAIARLYCGQSEEGYRLLDRIVAEQMPHADEARKILQRRSNLAEDHR